MTALWKLVSVLLQIQQQELVPYFLDHFIVIQFLPKVKFCILSAVYYNLPFIGK